MSSFRSNNVDDGAPGLIGRSVARVEDAGLVTGAARFVADLTPAELGLPTDPVYAVFVRSPFARATVTAIDTSEAASADGVVAIYTVDDLDLTPPGSLSSAIPDVYAQPLLAQGSVRYVGEPVALVLARSEAEGVDGAELVVVDYEPLDAVVDFDHARSNRDEMFDPTDRPHGANIVDVIEHTVYPSVDDTVDPPSVDDTVYPSVDDTSLWDDCDVVVSGEVMVPRQSPAPIETRGMVVWWNDGDLHIQAATQRPHGYRDQLAAQFDLPVDRIHVTAPRVGGGFGGKSSRSAEEHVLPVVARQCGRPVRWIETRSEYLAAATQGRGEWFELTIGGRTDGTMTAIDVKMVKDNGAYPTTCAFLPAAYTRPNLAGCYRFERIGFSSTSIVTTTAPVSAFRGAGRAAYIVALERMVDEFAHRVGLDPVDVRRRNLIPADAMPYTTPTGAVYDPADYQADLETALAAIDYDNVRLAQTVHDDSTVVTGIGVACYNHMTVGGGAEEAVVTITDDGGALVLTGTTDQGHGHYTTWAQIAGDALGIPLERIEVREGSTELTDTGVGAVGSRSLQTAGVAIGKACDAVIERARAVAARHLEAAEADIVFNTGPGGRFHVVGTPARSVGWAEVAAEANRAEVELSCGDIHDVEGQNSFPSGCHIAVVEVDRETGRVDLVRYVAVDDAGRRVNPMIVEGQIHGGIASGVAQALGEEVVYDTNGNLLTGNFGSYEIVSADQLPMFELTESETLSHFNPSGFKGVGESGTIGATPAVYNAVSDALRPYGVTQLELPCTPERVWSALQQSSG